MKIRKHYLLFLFCFVLTCISYAQNKPDSSFEITKHESESIFLNKEWKFKCGDNMSWANVQLNDNDWTVTATELNPKKRDSLKFSGIGWFRLHLNVDTSLSGKTYALLMLQSGASEIYFDGNLTYTFGKIGTNNADQERYDPREIPVAIHFNKTGPHLLAIRYSNYNIQLHSGSGFTAKMREINGAEFQKIEEVIGNVYAISSLGGFFTALSLLHFFLFFYYKAQKTNIYYAVFTGSISLLLGCYHIERNYHNPDLSIVINSIVFVLMPLVFVALLSLVYSLFNKPFSKFFRANVFLAVVYAVLEFIHAPFTFYIFILLLSSITITCMAHIIKAVINKADGAKILGVGLLMFAISVLVFIMIGIFTQGHINLNNNNWFNILLMILSLMSILSIPISMSLYLARQFAQINKTMGQQLIQVQELSAKTIAQDQEKKRILEGQKEELEIQVTQRTAEVVLQKKIIEEKNKDITDSINYAKLIQEAILPSKEIKYRIFPQSFVLFQPRDIVSGDFYWYSEKNGKKIIAAADCTGHGVPGAFMSMIGNSFLNEIVNEKGITKPAEILNHLRANIIKSLNQSNSGNTEIVTRKVQDGMDIALCMFDEKNKTVEFSGANNPLWIIRNGKLIEYKADKQPIGFHSGEIKPFTNHSIEIETGDSIYIFTDGYADQFGGAAGKKFKYKQLFELLLSIQDKKMNEQEKILLDKINEWKGNLEQVDDILVIGLKI